MKKKKDYFIKLKCHDYVVVNKDSLSSPVSDEFCTSSSSPGIMTDWLFTQGGKKEIAKDLDNYGKQAVFFFSPLWLVLGGVFDQWQCGWNLRDFVTSYSFITNG